MDIRRNDAVALPAFVTLNMAWIEDLHTVEDSDPRMATQPEIYIQGQNSVFSIHDGDIIAGVCALKEDHDGAFELTKMAVDTRYQGRGMGKILMDTVENYARDMGLAKIYLLSNTKNAAAIRLYKRCGWDIFLEGKHPQYSRCNIGMEKTL